MQKVRKFLLSRRIVIFLICAVFLSCLLASVVPQIARKPPRFFAAWEAGSPGIYHAIDLLQLNQVYSSAWFLILVALLALSLACSIYYQAKALLKSKRPARIETIKGYFREFTAVELGRGPGPDDAEIMRVFMARGYRSYPAADENGYYIFAKNRTGRWGGVVFHIGLLLCIAAALYGLAFKKEGFVQLAQNDTFQGRDKDWLTKRLGVLANDFNTGFQVRLNKLTPAYSEDKLIKDMEAGLTIIDGNESREFLLSPGSPVRFAGCKLSQSNYYGYVIGLMMEKAGGEKAFTNFFLDGPARKDEPFAGEMGFPTSDYILNMKFYPNLIEPSFYATLPGVDLLVTEKGEQRFKGRVLFSQRARLNDNTTLSFDEIRYWTGLNLAKDRGMPLLYWGFALTTLGALLVFTLPYKEIHLLVDKDGDQVRISMGGQAARYRAVFSEEFKELTDEMKRLSEEHGKHANA